MKNRNLFFLCAGLWLLSLVSCQERGKWELVWEDDFQQTELDTANWGKIPRWKVDWAKYMSNNEACYEMRDGNLILKGIVNPNRDADTATYLTGGVYTKHKRAFYGGRLEVKAKLQGAQGAWPAIWMKPYEEHKYPWPTGGEIDIMERLNHDTIAYQTVHSPYTQHFRQLKVENNPPQHTTTAIRPDDYNVYGVEMYPDSLVFFINGSRTFAYPRIQTELEGQYPYNIPYHLLIDMQLGGDWVGAIKPEELPVEIWIDWVRYYKERE